MLNVVLCEDNPEIISSVKRIISDYSLMEGLQDINIELVTANPLKVLKLFRTSIKHHDGRVECFAEPLKHRLLLLDIDLGELGKEQGLDGVSLAREIRKFDISSNIAFLTNNRLAITDVINYKTAPLAYLIKPFLGESEELLKLQIIDLLTTAYSRMSKDVVDKKIIEFKTGHRKIHVNLADIYYVHGNDNKNENVDDEIKSAATVLCEVGGKQYLKRSLNFYDQHIPELVKLGKSYLINPLNVRGTRTTKKYGFLTIANGEELRVMRESFDLYEMRVNEMMADA